MKILEFKIGTYDTKHNEEKDETIMQKALDLIETEDDLKYQKKYASVWKK